MNYSCGTRIGQMYHARLRTAFSSLNQHLFSKNIVNSPSCTYGAIEDTQHFLFVCNRTMILEENVSRPYQLAANRHSVCYFFGYWVTIS